MILSITGVFKMILMIIGVLVVLKFMGQLMIAKRNLAEEKQEKEAQKKFNDEKKQKLKSFGKTEIISKKQTDNVVDIDHEEL